ERSEILLSSKDDIRGVFDLHQAPVVRHAELASDRTIAPGEPVEGAMQVADGEVIGDPLGGGEVVELHECVVEQPVADPRLVELMGKPIVAVSQPCRVGPGPAKASPGPPTDPDVQISRIRLLGITGLLVEVGTRVAGASRAVGSSVSVSD